MTSTSHYCSPIGWLSLTAHEDALTAISWVTESVPRSKSSHEDHPIIQETKLQLEGYFNGLLHAFDLPIRFAHDAPHYYKAVWQLVSTIPYGSTRYYQEIAEALGDGNAMRAVGQANKRNPFAVVIPCHRVIGKHGDLTGYFAGLDRKRQLLAHENPHVFGLQANLF